MPFSHTGVICFDWFYVSPGCRFSKIEDSDIKNAYVVDKTPLQSLSNTGEVASSLVTMVDGSACQVDKSLQMA